MKEPDPVVCCTWVYENVQPRLMHCNYLELYTYQLQVFHVLENERDIFKDILISVKMYVVII